jgi:hypothetical protein
MALRFREINSSEIMDTIFQLESVLMCRAFLLPPKWRWILKLLDEMIKKKRTHGMLTIFGIVDRAGRVQTRRILRMFLAGITFQSISPETVLFSEARNRSTLKNIYHERCNTIVSEN